MNFNIFFNFYFVFFAVWEVLYPVSTHCSWNQSDCSEGSSASSKEQLQIHWWGSEGRMGERRDSVRIDIWLPVCCVCFICIRNTVKSQPSEWGQWCYLLGKLEKRINNTFLFIKARHTADFSHVRVYQRNLELLNVTCSTIPCNHNI